MDIQQAGLVIAGLLPFATLAYKYLMRNHPKEIKKNGDEEHITYR